MYRKFGKRLLDIIASICGLILLSPVMLVVAVIVRIRLGAPVIYSQERPGLHERVFKIYKFRTMTNDVNKNGELLSDEKRLTPLGKALRSASLDELPELWNILIGDMSVVGPRPLLVQYLPYYTYEEKQRHSVRPGLTGLAQINGRNLLEWNDRLRLDVEYVNSICLPRDIAIMFSTVVKRSKVVSRNEVPFYDLDIERDNAHDSSKLGHK